MRTTHGTCLSLSPVAHGALTRLATTWGISRSAVVEIVLCHAGAALDTTVAALETWVRVQTCASPGDAPPGWTGEAGAPGRDRAWGQDKGEPADAPLPLQHQPLPNRQGVCAPVGDASALLFK